VGVVGSMDRGHGQHRHRLAYANDGDDSLRRIDGRPLHPTAHKQHNAVMIILLHTDRCEVIHYRGAGVKLDTEL
jgi:hypothetical protein